MKRISEQSLVLSGAVILSVIAQSLLLTPALSLSLSRILLETNPLVRFGLPVLYYVAGLLLLACVFAAPTLLARRLFLVLGAVSLLDLASLYAEQTLAIGALICAAIALGLLGALLPPSRLNSPNPTSWLLQICTALNALVGVLLLVAPRIALHSQAFVEIPLGASILAALFLGSAVLVFLPRRRAGITEAIRGRGLAIPWLIWCVILLAQRAEPALLLPPLLLALVLLLADAIPYADLLLPNSEAGVPHVFLPTCIALTAVLGLLAALTASAPALAIPAVWREIVLLCSVGFYFGGGAFVAMTNLIAGQLASARGQSEVKRAELSQYYQLVWEEAAKDLVRPYQEAAASASQRLAQDEAELEKATVELASERRQLRQVMLVAEVDEFLKPVLDQPVAAQLTANILQRGFDAALVTVLSFDSARNELVFVAGAGNLTGTVPPGYRQNIQRGMAGRAARLRKTQFAADTRQDPDHFSLENQSLLCEAAVPLLDHGQLKGMILVDSDEANALSGKDVQTVEVVSDRLVSAWEHSSYDARLRELIQAGITLTGTLETEAALREIASTAQRILESRFVFVTLLDRGGGFRRSSHAGYAPKLLGQLTSTPDNSPLLEYVLSATQVFRLRDVRTQTEALFLDAPGLRTLLATPIRLRGTHIGALLAFGKQGKVAFSEEDESLASLIGNQAAAAIETTWLYQQLRGAASTATLLYELSANILQSEELTDAAAIVVQTAYRLSDADEAGIVLFSSDQEIEAQVEMDPTGVHPGSRHPISLIKQAIQTAQPILVSAGEKATVCLPLQTPHRGYGGMWLNIQENLWQKEGYADNLQTLANQAALALERGILLGETRRQEEQLRRALDELEITYDQTLIALTSALDARDRETEGHSMRVSKLTCALGERVGLNETQLKVLERGALLHDIGKIGISDTILLKPGPLDEHEWELMRRHPDIGARIIEGIPFLEEALPIIRYHQERWDGSGYPIGLRAGEIPFSARIFAVADVFDALTSHRPYRNRQTTQQALAYLQAEAGIQFDPEVVTALVKLVSEGEILEYILP